MVIKKYLFAILFLPFVLFAQVPDYYSNVDFNQSEENIKIQLKRIITDTHINLIPYTSSYTDTWDVLKQSDLEYQTGNNVLLIYGYDDNDNIEKNDYVRDKDLSCHSSSCIGLWNREHVFAKSLANPSLDNSSPGSGTDVHNLRSSDSQMNSSRNNRIYQDDTGNSHITSIGNFYPGDQWKGDVARIIMYMYTRYPSQCEAINIGYGNLNTSATMPNVFLKWNVEDPVSQFEKDRNEVIYGAQGNRNPYIDNPYVATLIWGGEKAENTWGTLSIKTTDEQSIKIYPTITSDYIYIKNIFGNKAISYSIYNMLGKEVLTTKSVNRIDVSNLSKGMYVLKVKTNYTIESKKIIKQ